MHSYLTKPSEVCVIFQCMEDSFRQLSYRVPLLKKLNQRLASVRPTMRLTASKEERGVNSSY